MTTEMATYIQMKHSCVCGKTYVHQPALARHHGTCDIYKRVGDGKKIKMVIREEKPDDIPAPIQAPVIEATTVIRRMSPSMEFEYLRDKQLNMLERMKQLQLIVNEMVETNERAVKHLENLIDYKKA
jgi:hypothetical protein